MRSALRAFAVFVVSVHARVALAQCPDGSPPPCSGRSAGAVPSAADRGRRFLILPFRNLTRSPGQEWLIEGSPVLLGDALRQWQEIRVVPDERMYPALARLGLVPGTVLDIALIRRVAEATGAWTAVYGEIVSIAPRVEIGVRAYDMATGRVLMSTTASVSPSDDVRDAYSRIGTSLLRLAGLDTGSVDIAAVTTRSLDAYRAYTRGLAHLSRGEVRQAQSDLREATHRDGMFAQAYARLAIASAWVDPVALADRNSDATGYVERASALAARLPPRDRRIVGAAYATVHGRLGEARRLLEGLVADDSADLEALGFLADLEFYDPILQPVPGGERPRGSLNRAAFLSVRALDLEPTQHNAYRRLVDIYAMAGGAGRGMTVGLRGERASLAELLSAKWDRIFVGILRDSIELVPVESLSVIPRETLLVRHRAAIAVARQWTDRWLAAAPAESEAYLMLSYLYEAAGQPDSAILALDRADELGIEYGLDHVPLRRLALEVEAGHRRDALRHADRMIDRLTPRDLAMPSLERAATVVRALGSLFCLYLTTGRTADAGRLLTLVGRRYGGAERALREVLFDPTPFGSPTLALPSSLRVEAAESLLARGRRSSLPGTMDRFLPDIIRLSMEDASPEDRARVAEHATDLALQFGERGATDAANGLAVAVAYEPEQRARLERTSWYHP